MTGAPFGPPVLMDGSHVAGCSCVDCKIARVHREAASYRRRLRVAERNTRALLDWYLGTWLVDVRDFDTFITLAAVTRADGSIDFTELEKHLRELLAERPHLAAQ